MEIIDKYITGTVLTLVFDQNIPTETTTIRVDYGENYYKNTKVGKHDLLYNTPTVTDTQIQIELPSDASALLVITVYIGDAGYITTFLNRYMLFKAQNKHLAVHNCMKCDNGMCQDCNEKSWRTETLAILLRTQLLNYAYDNGLIDDTVKFYVELNRVLDFSGIVFESIPSYNDNLNNQQQLYVE